LQLLITLFVCAAAAAAGCALPTIARCYWGQCCLATLFHLLQLLITLFVCAAAAGCALPTTVRRCWWQYCLATSLQWRSSLHWELMPIYLQGQSRSQQYT
jgi:hypothetical protein